MAFLIAIGAGVVLTPIAHAVGLLTRIVDHPDGGGLKIHRRPIPLTGGIAVTGAILIALAIADRLPSAWVLGAVGLALLAGMIDDVLSLPATLRLLAQAGSGLLLVGAGVRLEALGLLDGPAVVLLVLATTNAVNLIDGQDGLAGGLGAVAALGLAALLAWQGEAAGTTLALATAGALIGFLVLNRPPARIFLGNGGAYAVGALLAVQVGSLGGHGWRPLLAAALCLGVFAFELLFTVARRAGTRRPMAGGDRGHSYDLVALRAGDRLTATLLFLALGIVCAALALVVGRAPLALGAAIVAAASAAGWMWGRRLLAGGRRRIRVA